MIPTTSLKVEEYNITDTSNREFHGFASFPFVQKTLTKVSSFQNENTILSTYGKYSNEKVNLIEALLEEHKAERDRENNKIEPQ